jgi:aldose 1-epimerase
MANLTNLSRRRLLQGTVAGALAVALPVDARPGLTPNDANGDGSLPSGRQFQLTRGDVRATVTEVGAGLRTLSAGTLQIVVGFPDGWATDSAFGQVLVPWPNRIAGGRYTDPQGRAQQLPINEPMGNATNGLARWQNWTPISQGRDRIVLGLTLHHSTGYPFVLRFEQEYRLTGQGLEVRNTTRNIGTVAAPFGLGYHPYLAVGTQRVDQDVLQSPARSYFPATDRNIPIPPPRSVAASPYDFRRPRLIGGTRLDTGFGDLARDTDGLARVHLAAPGESPPVAVWMDQAFGFLQLYTGDTMPFVDRRRRSIAIEPYTCAADAFNNGYGLRVLRPGATFSGRWGITVER